MIYYWIVSFFRYLISDLRVEYLIVRKRRKLYKNKLSANELINIICSLYFFHMKLLLSRAGFTEIVNFYTLSSFVILCCRVRCCTLVNYLQLIMFMMAIWTWQNNMLFLHLSSNLRVGTEGISTLLIQYYTYIIFIVDIFNLSFL